MGQVTVSSEHAEFCFPGSGAVQVRLTPVVSLARTFKVRFLLNPLATGKFKAIPGKSGSSPQVGLAEPGSLCREAADHAGREVPSRGSLSS